ncbi:MAG: alpha-isopropylmalate synthase regulatory domain-containing protein [Eubacteriales bacterium]|nr:alpha-isopropylmalate synthase regulatory domain-containing protein [Eubacteriales bacterium]
MRKIIFSDVTMKNSEKAGNVSLSFREKIEVAKLLDRLGADVIEIEGIENDQADALRIKSICTAVNGSTLAVPVKLSRENQDMVLNAVKSARKVRLQVEVPVSVVQMEYIYHKKPQVIFDEVKEAVSYLKGQNVEVEFAALDATRADREFLSSIMQAAIEAGAKTVTVTDNAGVMLPEEFGDFVKGLFEEVPGLKDVAFAVSCTNELSMADACAVAAIKNGANEVKAGAGSVNAPSLRNLAKVLSQRGDALDACSSIRNAELNRVMDQINNILSTEKSSGSPFESGVREYSDTDVLSADDSMESLKKACEKLGYELSSEDVIKVYDAFKKIAAKKETVGLKELESIVAAEAMQVPETYKLSDYMISISGEREALAHIKIEKDGTVMDGLSLGDGPVDASYLAIEKVTGCHYELDDFQIQAITEGREAMGQTIVRLRSKGKLYSGKGISTDVVGSAILAYMNALNKIVYEEALS